MNEIRVPSKVVRYWNDQNGTFCGLEDGRIFQVVLMDIKPADHPPYKWVQVTPAIPDR